MTGDWIPEESMITGEAVLVTSLLEADAEIEEGVNDPGLVVELDLVISASIYYHFIVNSISKLT